MKNHNSKTHNILILSDEVLEHYTGNYIDSYGRNLTIIKEDGALKISGTGVPTIKLYPETENKFFPKEIEVQFEFTTSDSLIIKVEGGKIDCTAKKVK
jgi:hypothetical protein